MKVEGNYTPGERSKRAWFIVEAVVLSVISILTTSQVIKAMQLPEPSLKGSLAESSDVVRQVQSKPTATHPEKQSPVKPVEPTLAALSLDTSDNTKSNISNLDSRIFGQTTNELPTKTKIYSDLSTKIDQASTLDVLTELRNMAKQSGQKSDEIAALSKIYSIQLHIHDQEVERVRAKIEESFRVQQSADVKLQIQNRLAELQQGKMALDAMLTELNTLRSTANNSPSTN
jgi:hypothetical protein